MEQVIKIQITAEPRTFSMADRSTFEVGFQAVNKGKKTEDPNLYSTVLEVNGNRNYAWDLAVQNGPREENWKALLPGESVSASWPLGEALFEAPGIYKLTLFYGKEKTTVRIRVLP